MTGIERTANFLKRKPIDRIPVFEHFWGDTKDRYVAEGFMRDDEPNFEHFNFDMATRWPFNFVIDMDFERQVIEENEDTILYLDGNGAKLRRHKHHDTTPEHVDFTIKGPEQWAAAKEKLLSDKERRINFEEYRLAKEQARAGDRFFFWSGINVFECVHPICGHEEMLVGMALEPDWIHDMYDTYAKLNVELQEILFAKEGYPDGIWYYEDMGFKERPFISPEMYKELVEPYHTYTIDFAKSKNMPVVMHCCGFAEPLIPGFLRAGIDCLQAIEVKAGMDLVRIYKNFGDNLSLMGGLDIREVCTNDKARIDKELESKIPIVMQKYGYALHSDHSIPRDVNYDTLQYFFQRGIEIGTYK